MQSVLAFSPLSYHHFVGWIFVRCLINDTSDVLNGIEIRRGCLPAILGYKVWQILLQCLGCLCSVSRCSVASSWATDISFFVRKDFLSIGQTVTWRLDVNGFTEVKVWPVGSMCNHPSCHPTPSLSHFASFRYLSVCTSLSRLIFEHHWSKQTVIRFLVSIRSILFSTTCSPNIPSCKKIAISLAEWPDDHRNMAAWALA